MISEPDKWEHQDTSILNPTKTFYVEFIRTNHLERRIPRRRRQEQNSQCHLCITNAKTRRNIVSEEVPIIRLMRLFNVKEQDISNVNRQTFSKEKVIKISDRLKLRTNDYIRIPRRLLMRSIENDELDEESTRVVLFIQEMYTKQVSQKDEIFMKGVIKYPIEDEKQNYYIIHLKDIEDNQQYIEVIERLKYSTGTIIKAVPNEVREFGETCTDDDEFHYAIIKK